MQPTPCSRHPAAHDDEQQPSASSTGEGGGSSGADGAVTDEPLQQEITIELQKLQQQQPSASSTEGGGGSGGANVGADESLRQEIRIDIDRSVPRGGAGDELKSRWICRVHPSIREKQVQAYEPKLVSIGPLFHGDKSLLPMEATKKRYVRTLLARSPAESNTLEGYIAAIRKIEDRARTAYPEDEIPGICFDSDAFAKMLLVDGCFIVEYMLREFFGEKQEDDVWGNLYNLERDVMLLENQIPFFVLEGLFFRTHAPAPEGFTSRYSSSSASFVQIALHFLGVEADHSEEIMNMILGRDGKYHLLHLSHMCWQLRDIPATSRYSRARHTVVAMISYLIGVVIWLIKQAIFCLLFLLLINEWPWSRHKPDLLKKIPCAADLDMSGVKFRRNVLRRSSSVQQYLEGQYNLEERMTFFCWGDGVRHRSNTENLGERISFGWREGLLEIPFVKVVPTLNARLRNFIALEQCQRKGQTGLPFDYSAYVSFMNSIIYTPADVALLRKYGVIEILFGSDEDVARMFKSIYEDTNLCEVQITQISELSKQVNAYCNVPYHRWRGRLRSSYLRSPWSTIALLAGSIMLGLTATQTYFTIRQSYK